MTERGLQKRDRSKKELFIADLEAQDAAGVTSALGAGDARRAIAAERRRKSSQDAELAGFDAHSLPSEDAVEHASEKPRRAKTVRITRDGQSPDLVYAAKRLPTDGEGIPSGSDAAFVEAMEEGVGLPAVGRKVKRSQHEEDLEAHRASTRRLLGGEKGWLIDDDELAEARALQAAEEAAKKAAEDEVTRGDIFKNLPPYSGRPRPGLGKTKPGTNIPTEKSPLLALDKKLRKKIWTLVLTANDTDSGTDDTTPPKPRYTGVEDPGITVTMKELNASIFRVCRTVRAEAIACNFSTPDDWIVTVSHMEKLSEYFATLSPLNRFTMLYTENLTIFVLMPRAHDGCQQPREPGTKTYNAVYFFRIQDGDWLRCIEICPSDGCVCDRLVVANEFDAEYAAINKIIRTGLSARTEQRKQPVVTVRMVEDGEDSLAFPGGPRGKGGFSDQWGWHMRKLMSYE